MNDVINRSFKVGQAVMVEFKLEGVTLIMHGTFRQYGGYKHNADGATIATTGLVDIGGGKHALVDLEKITTKVPEMPVAENSPESVDGQKLAENGDAERTQG